MAGPSRPASFAGKWPRAAGEAQGESRPTSWPPANLQGLAEQMIPQASRRRPFLPTKRATFSTRAGGRANASSLPRARPTGISLPWPARLPSELARAFSRPSSKDSPSDAWSQGRGPTAESNIDVTLQRLVEPEELRGVGHDGLCSRRPAVHHPRSPPRKGGGVARRSARTRAPPGPHEGPKHARGDADFAGGAEVHQRGTAVHQRRAAVHQRGADDLEGRGCSRSTRSCRRSTASCSRKVDELSRLATAT